MNSQLETVVFEMEKAVRGKRGVIEHILAALLAEGHILLDDMPGVGKTTLAVALSRAVDLRYRRVQFTPDVMPSDIVGFSVYEPQSGQFVYHEGAATHANLLLGDEINRTSSKTQSALLEAMEERQITVDGRTYPLEKPFVVIATQNNVGTAGTQFLPYAQVDRFMVRLSVGYPDHDAQMALLRDRLSENPLDAVKQVLTREELLAMQADVRAVQTGDALLDYITRLTMASREHPNVEVGVSPRGALLLCRMAKAWRRARSCATTPAALPKRSRASAWTPARATWCASCWPTCPIRIARPYENEPPVLPDRAGRRRRAVFL